VLEYGILAADGIHKSEHTVHAVRRLPFDELTGWIENKALALHLDFAGLSFETWQWYKNGAPIPEEGRGYILADHTSHYALTLLTTDGRELRTCPEWNEEATPVAVDCGASGVSVCKDAIHRVSTGTSIFDIHGNRVHGIPKTPGVYIVRQGSQTKTIVVR
jgi:hypothetical protein